MPKLADLTLKIGSGATPRGGKNAYKGGEFFLIRSQNVLDFSFSFDGLVKINAEQASALSNVEVFEGDVLLNITGESVARCCQVDPDCLPARVNQHVCIIRPKPNVLDARFLKYFFLEPSQKQHLLMLSSAGATRSALTKGMIENLEIADFSITEQRAIAHLLGTLDDKIAINRKMNQTLQDIAKAIFKSWFVDFDPVRAKAEGRSTGLPADISDLFPDALVDSEDGEIPAQWKTTTISGFADLNTKSINPSNSDEIFDHFSIPAFDNGGVPVTQAGKGIKSNKTLLPSKCLLVSKLNPDTPRIWYPDNAKERRQICSTEFLALTPKNGDTSAFLWGLFTSNLVSERMTAMVTGTSKSHQRVKPRDVLDIPVIAAPPSLVEAFCELVSPILERTLLSKEEITILSELRDTLLPKLISGELRIPDAEKFLAKAGIEWR